MKTSFNSLLLVLAVVVDGMAGCKKSDSKLAGPTWTAGHSVYFAGDDSGRAAYWKNGVKMVLDSGSVEGITVSGSSVYLGGFVVKNTDTGLSIQAAYWRDGVETRLTDSGMGYGYQPVVAGGDVYVPGFTLPGHLMGNRPDPVYWKNGQRVEVAPGVLAAVNGMAVDGTDIYVIGDIITPSIDTALVWKNGVRMPGTTAVGIGGYRQILISGGNMYLVGLKGYFTNTTNQYTELPGAGVTGSAICLFPNGSDIYVAGGIDSSNMSWPAYWKNGVLVRLPGFPGATIGIARGIVVAGSDVYAAGTLGVAGKGSAVYWKNGVEVTLSNAGDVWGAAVGN